MMPKSGKPDFGASGGEGARAAIPPRRAGRGRASALLTSHQKSQAKLPFAASARLRARKKAHCKKNAGDLQGAGVRQIQERSLKQRRKRRERRTGE
jgi:hypothetical protein